MSEIVFEIVFVSEIVFGGDGIVWCMSLMRGYHACYFTEAVFEPLSDMVNKGQTDLCLYINSEYVGSLD